MPHAPQVAPTGEHQGTLGRGQASKCRQEAGVPNTRVEGLTAACWKGSAHNVLKAPQVLTSFLPHLAKSAPQPQIHPDISTSCPLSCPQYGATTP